MDLPPASSMTLSPFDQKIGEIRSRCLIARTTKDKTAQDALLPLLGDIETRSKGKEPFDESTLYGVINSHLSGVTECLFTLQKEYHYDDPAIQDKLRSLEQQIIILRELLPEKMSSKKLTELVADYVKNSKDDLGPRDMGKVMAYFKAEYPGRYDGKVLSGIVKEFLQ